MRTTANPRHRAWMLLALAPALLHAQPIYRCGHNTYGQTPCPDGVVIRADDSRSAAQKAQTDAATVQAARLAGRMEHDRLAAERRAVATSPRPALDPARRPKAAARAPARPAGGTAPRAAARSRPKMGEDFTALARSDEAKKQPAVAPPRD